MSLNKNKMIVVPIDGSENALKPLSYLNLIFDSKSNLSITLLYITPELPPFLLDEKRKDSGILSKLRAIESRNIALGEKFLEQGKIALLSKGFHENQIRTLQLDRHLGIARDICNFSENSQAKAIALSTRGRSRLEVFFMGETAGKVLEFSHNCPIWLLKGSARKKPVLIAVDGSENSLRAVRHAGDVLAGTECRVSLFHTTRNLKRFVPGESLSDVPELEEVWKIKAANEIAPAMKKAKEILLDAGLDKAQIVTRVVGGGHSAAHNILEESKKNGFGTIVLGRRGLTDETRYKMGSVTRKIVDEFMDAALWIAP